MKKNDNLPKVPFFLSLFFVLLWSVSSYGAVQMPSFTLKSARDGAALASSSYQGKVLLVTFFATWCPPCVQEVPSLVRLQNKHASDGFSVLALSVDQGKPKTVKKFIEQKGITYPVAMADQQVMRDFGGIYGIPVAFLVDRGGNVVKRYTGYVAHDLLEKDIISLL